MRAGRMNSRSEEQSADEEVCPEGRRATYESINRARAIEFDIPFSFCNFFSLHAPIVKINKTMTINIRICHNLVFKIEIRMICFILLLFSRELTCIKSQRKLIVS